MSSNTSILDAYSHILLSVYRTKTKLTPLELSYRVKFVIRTQGISLSKLFNNGVYVLAGKKFRSKGDMAIAEMNLLYNSPYKYLVLSVIDSKETYWFRDKDGNLVDEKQKHHNDFEDVDNWYRRPVEIAH